MGEYWINGVGGLNYAPARLGSVKGMYGSGTYFADMASKADQYAGQRRGRTRSRFLGPLRRIPGRDDLGPLFHGPKRIERIGFGWRSPWPQRAKRTVPFVPIAWLLLGNMSSIFDLIVV